MRPRIASGLAAALLLTACTTTTRPPHPTSTSTTTTSTTAPPPTTTSVPVTTTTLRPAAPTPTTVPVSAPRVTACPSPIVDAVHRHFDRFGTDVADWFVGIVWRESNCRPDVVSPSGCRGLSQLALPLHADLFTAQGLDWQTSWMDPDANLEAAALLYASSGASPWRL